MPKTILTKEKLKQRIVYSGVHAGVTVEIINWSFGPDEPLDKWSYYLFLELDKIEDKELVEILWLPEQQMQITPTSPVRVSYDYYSNSFLCSLEMHGGITFYDKVMWNTKRVAKVGCDFLHLYDNQTGWTVDLVLADLVKCIDEMLTRITYV